MQVLLRGRLCHVLGSCPARLKFTRKPPRTCISCPRSLKYFSTSLSKSQALSFKFDLEDIGGTPRGRTTDQMRRIAAPIYSHPSTPPLPARPHSLKGLVCFAQKSRTALNGQLLCTVRVVMLRLEALGPSRTCWNI